VDCDLIVCWRDGWENPPLPVWALEDYVGEEVEVIRAVLSKFSPKSYLNQALDDLKKLEQLLRKRELEFQKCVNWEFKILPADSILAIAAVCFLIANGYRLIKWTWPIVRNYWFSFFG